MAVAFLIVQSEMLQTDSHAILLNSLNIRNAHLAGEERILTHIFEIAPVERSPVNVDSRTQKNVLLAISGFLADALAVECRSLLVPGCRQAGQCREGGAGVIGPAGLVPLVPFYFRTYTVRAVGAP